jgi:hypothetical protein
MSIRIDYRTAIIAAINGYTEVIAESITATAWNGDPEAFNVPADTSAIFVSYAGARFGPNETIGGGAYTREFLYNVYVVSPSNDIAATLLEDIETNLPGTISGRRIDIEGNEELDRAEAGVFLFSQTYAVNHAQK